MGSIHRTLLCALTALVLTAVPVEAEVEPLSIDEAFLDMSPSEHIFGVPKDIGKKIKQAVLAATGLHISVGVSATKYVAKVASAHDKPNGLTVVPPDEAEAWLDPQPIRRLWGVGKKTGERLEALGLYTIGDIARAEPEFLTHHLGQTGAHFYNLSRAKDPRLGHHATVG